MMATSSFTRVNEPVLKPKKRNLFQKIGDWWKSLSREDQEWLTACGLFAIDGAVIGGLCTAAYSQRKMSKQIQIAYLLGAHDGEVTAYQQMINTKTQIPSDLKVKRF